MSSTEVPQGTVQDVLDWVGDDPDRAQTALDAERDGQNRSTLVTQLEATACRQDDDSGDSDTTDDTATDSATGTALEPSPSGTGGEVGTADEEVDSDLAPGPEQPREVAINPADEGTTVFGTVPRDRDTEVPEEPLFGYPLPVATAPTTTGTARVAFFDKEVSREDAEGEPIEGEQVELLDGAAAGHGFALGINGQAFIFTAQMTGALKGMVDKAVAGMAL